MAAKKRKLKFNVPKLDEWLSANAPGAYKKLSDRSGYSIPSIEKLRQGKGNRIPRADHLQGLAEGMSCKLEDLIVFEAD